MMQRPTPAARKRPRLHRVVMLQGLMAVTLTGISLAVAGPQAALDALSGSIVSVVPNLYFAWRMFRSAGHAHAMASSLYTAEAGKFGLTVALFAIAFATVPPSNPALFFCAYVAASFVHWLAPWLMRDRSSPWT